MEKNRNYYEKRYILFELLRELKDRDFSLLGSQENNIRGLSIKCLFDFDRAINWAGWYRNKQNLYVSLAKLKSIPKFTFNAKARSAETNPWYRNDYSNYVLTYDLFFDFDNKYTLIREDGKKEEIKGSWEEVITEVKILKEYLEDYQVPYTLIFSGNKGFQIRILGDYLDIEKIEKGNVQPHKKIVEKIKEELELKFLDLANNGVNSRLCKLPYSLVLSGCKKELSEKELSEYPESEMNIALPLSDSQLDNFKFEDMKMDNVLRNKEIVMNHRGNLERFSDLNLEKKRRNTEEFIKLFFFNKP